ncbi:hypothetical protein ABZ281_17900 [Streptomyces sp. NPDC006265]|uniref:hypothetical protein n=1 Tax=Streptomyces sp. NPDC006265 TaxID=3156740 RepID=UPI0033AD3D88
MSDAGASLTDSVRAEVAGTFDGKPMSLDDSFANPRMNPIAVPRPTSALEGRFDAFMEPAAPFQAESVAARAELAVASVNRRDGE